MYNLTPYTVVQVSDDRWQVNQGAQYVACRASEAAARQTVAEYTRQEIEAYRAIHGKYPGE